MYSRVTKKLLNFNTILFGKIEILGHFFNNFI